MPEFHKGPRQRCNYIGQPAGLGIWHALRSCKDNVHPGFNKADGSLMTSVRAVKPNKARLGQNFLVDDQAARRIVDALGDLRNAKVIEIGPGKGAITKILAEKAKKLIAVELDRMLAARLRAEYST